MKKLFLSLFLVSLVLTGCGKKAVAPVQQAPLVDKEKMSFEERLQVFSAVYKPALLAADEAVVKLEKRDEARNLARMTWEEWKGVTKSFLARQPAEYKRTDNWGATLEGISKTIELANENLVGEKYEEGFQKLREVNKALVGMRKENDVKSVDDVIFVYLDIVDKIDSAKSREEAIKQLPLLKRKYMDFKNFDLGAQYQKDLVNLEKAMSGIENSTNKTFPSYQPLLKPAFLELYLHFG